MTLSCHCADVALGNYRSLQDGGPNGVQDMNRSDVGRFLGLVIVLSCQYPEVSRAEPIEVFRAEVAMENEDMQAAVRKRLGCGQCSEVIAVDSNGAHVRFTLSPRPSLSIEPSEIVAVVIQELGTENQEARLFQLMLELSDNAEQKLASIAALPAAYGASFHKGHLVGVGPLMAFGPYYVVGVYDSKSEVREAAGRFGLETSFVPYDEQRHQQLRKKMLEGER